MNQTIRKRIEDIKNGIVPEGYKKTKVGIVPSAWEIHPLSMHLIESRIEGSNGAIAKKLTVKLWNKGVFEKKELHEGSEKTTYYKRKKGQFIYSKLDFLNCAFGIIPEELDGYESTVDLPCFDMQKVNSYFLLTYVTQINFYKHFGMIADGGRKARRVGPADMLSFPLVYPPVVEQEKIAGILETQDKVIWLKEKLIEQKKQQKKYLMQQLLTGKKRLLGFTVEWKKEKLGKHMYEYVFKNTDRQVEKVLSVNNKLGFIDQEEQFGKRIASEDVVTYKVLSKGCIAYNPSRINVGSIALYKDDKLGIVSPMYVVLKLKETLNPDYFMALVKTNLFFQQMKILLAGSVRDSLKFNDLCQLEFKMPSIEEQQAIAGILLQTDKEIELLQKDLEEEKNKKKALIQLLLTGIVRVV